MIACHRKPDIRIGKMHKSSIHLIQNNLLRLNTAFKVVAKVTYGFVYLPTINLLNYCEIFLADRQPRARRFVDGRSGRRRSDGVPRGGRLDAPISVCYSRPMPRKVSFLTFLSPDVRRRHEHIRIGGRVISFVVQIELLAGNQWHQVVRYDTAHGFAHRDLMKPDGKLEKTPLFLHTYSEALDFAEADLKANWPIYVERYLKELNQ